MLERKEKMNKYYCVSLKGLVNNGRFKLQTIAKRINMDAKYFEDLVNCNVEQTMEDYIKISNYFNITIDYLLGIRSVGETIAGTQDEETTDFFVRLILTYNELSEIRKEMGNLNNRRVDLKNL